LNRLARQLYDPRVVKRWQAAVTLVVAVAALAGCGGGGSKTEVVESTAPALANLYLAITGPAAITQIISHAVLTGSSAIIVSKPVGPKVCSYTPAIAPSMASGIKSLQKDIGDNFTIAVYATNPQAAAVCKQIGNEFS
jgi:hypothetical protein